MLIICIRDIPLCCKIQYNTIKNIKWNVYVKLKAYITYATDKVNLFHNKAILVSIAFLTKLG